MSQEKGKKISIMKIDEIIQSVQEQELNLNNIAAELGINQPSFESSFSFQNSKSETKMRSSVPETAKSHDHQRSDDRANSISKQVIKKQDQRQISNQIPKLQDLNEDFSKLQVDYRFQTARDNQNEEQLQFSFSHPSESKHKVKTHQQNRQRRDLQIKQKIQNSLNRVNSDEMQITASSLGQRAKVQTSTQQQSKRKPIFKQNVYNQFKSMSNLRQDSLPFFALSELNLQYPQNESPKQKRILGGRSQSTIQISTADENKTQFRMTRIKSKSARNITQHQAEKIKEVSIQDTETQLKTQEKPDYTPKINFSKFINKSITKLQKQSDPFSTDFTKQNLNIKNKDTHQQLIQLRFDKMKKLNRKREIIQNQFQIIKNNNLVDNQQKQIKPQIIKDIEQDKSYFNSQYHSSKQLLYGKNSKENFEEIYAGLLRNKQFLNDNYKDNVQFTIDSTILNTKIQQVFEFSQVQIENVTQEENKIQNFYTNLIYQNIIGQFQNSIKNYKNMADISPESFNIDLQQIFDEIQKMQVKEVCNDMQTQTYIEQINNLYQRSVYVILNSNHSDDSSQKQNIFLVQIGMILQLFSSSFLMLLNQTNQNKQSEIKNQLNTQKENFTTEIEDLKDQISFLQTYQAAEMKELQAKIKRYDGVFQAQEEKFRKQQDTIYEYNFKLETLSQYKNQDPEVKKIQKLDQQFTELLDDLDYNQNKIKLQLGLIGQVVQVEIQSEINYEQKVNSNKNLMGYLAELDSYQKRQRNYETNCPKLLLRLNQGSIENNLIPLIEMEPFIEKYNSLKNDKENIFDKEKVHNRCSFNNHLKQVSYYINSLIDNMKVVNVYDIKNDEHDHEINHNNHQDHELVRYSLNLTDFMTSFYNILNIISGGNKKKIYKNLCIFYLSNQKFIKEAKNSSDKQITEYLDILQLIEDLLTGKLTQKCCFFNEFLILYFIKFMRPTEEQMVINQSQKEQSESIARQKRQTWMSNKTQSLISIVPKPAIVNKSKGLEPIQEESQSLSIPNMNKDILVNDKNKQRSSSSFKTLRSIGSEQEQKHVKASDHLLTITNTTKNVRRQSQRLHSEVHHHVQFRPSKIHKIPIISVKSPDEISSASSSSEHEQDQNSLEKTQPWKESDTKSQVPKLHNHFSQIELNEIQQFKTKNQNINLFNAIYLSIQIFSLLDKKCESQQNRICEQSFLQREVLTNLFHILKSNATEQLDSKFIVFASYFQRKNLIYNKEMNQIRYEIQNIKKQLDEINFDKNKTYRGNSNSRVRASEIQDSFIFNSLNKNDYYQRRSSEEFKEYNDSGKIMMGKFQNALKQQIEKKVEAMRSNDSIFDKQAALVKNVRKILFINQDLRTKLTYCALSKMLIYVISEPSINEKDSKDLNAHGQIGQKMLLAKLKKQFNNFSHENILDSSLGLSIEQLETQILEKHWSLVLSPYEIQALSSSLWIIESQFILKRQYQFGNHETSIAIKIPESLNKLMKSIKISYRDLILDYSSGRMGLKSQEYDACIQGKTFISLIQYSFKKLSDLKKFTLNKKLTQMEKDEIEIYQSRNLNEVNQKKKVDKMSITNLGVFMDVLNKSNPQLGHICPFTLIVNSSVQQRSANSVLLKIHSELIQNYQIIKFQDKLETQRRIDKKQAGAIVLKKTPKQIKMEYEVAKQLIKKYGLMKYISFDTSSFKNSQILHNLLQLDLPSNSDAHSLLEKEKDSQISGIKLEFQMGQIPGKNKAEHKVDHSAKIASYHKNH